MNLTPNEVLIISLVALVALGPKQLPQVARQLAKGTAQLRRFSSQIKTEFESAIDDAVAEAHGRDLEQQQEELANENEDTTATGEEE
ncbi:MAG: twin-arginine translocase TatA/TatE family subunit [Acidimicrobiales bacterium]|nr:twin-arginine translocase TatA/TatE family subunit [Acidimicrobiales bacterium]